MECHSEPDKGSKFSLTVPLETTPEDARDTLDANRTQNIASDLGLVIRVDELQNLGQVDDTESDENARRLSLEGKNIMVVEDNWAHQVVTEKRLTTMGCKTKIAVHGENALALMKNGTFAPDIILMDLQMPMMVRAHESK